ncbi:beta-1,6-N-acetylglucosaminyltransferase [Lacticaseibacillus suihuaensis]
MAKHACLIMAHQQVGLLKKIIRMIDDPRNDIYIHIDKKSKIDESDLVEIAQFSKVTLTNRISVSWGSYSLVQAILLLLKKARSTSHYMYYHLITGADLPLVSQRVMHNFFDQHQGEEFISLRQIEPISDLHFLNRVAYYYPFQQLLGRPGTLAKILRHLSVAPQKMLHVSRIDFTEPFGIGSTYFDITDAFAEYIISHEDLIRKTFSKTYCADELFVQTLFLRSNGFIRYHYTGPSLKHVERTYLDAKRFIDWERGNPYVFTEADFDDLCASGCFFARKVDEIRSSKLIDAFYARVMADHDLTI